MDVLGVEIPGGWQTPPDDAVPHPSVEPVCGRDRPRAAGARLWRAGALERVGFSAAAVGLGRVSASRLAARSNWIPAFTGMTSKASAKRAFDRSGVINAA
jgi:hypothetical protein